MLAPGPGRAAALTIVGVPLAICLLIGFITAHAGDGSASGDEPTGAGSYSTTPLDVPSSEVGSEAFPGTYTVSGGHITSANVRQTSGR